MYKSVLQYRENLVQLPLTTGRKVLIAVRFCSGHSFGGAMETKATGVIRLDFRSEEQVLVIPDDQDRFVTTVRDAALACKHYDQFGEWKEQYNDFLTFLHEWCIKHHDKVRAGYVTIGDASLNVLVFLHSAEYDFDFENEIVELDVKLADQFPLCSAEVLQVPNQPDLTGELPDEALCVYGDGEFPSETGDSQ